MSVLAKVGAERSARKAISLRPFFIPNASNGSVEPDKLPVDIVWNLISRLTSRASETTKILDCRAHDDGHGVSIQIQDTHVQNFTLSVSARNDNVHIHIEIPSPGKPGAITLEPKEAIRAFKKIGNDRKTPLLDALVKIIPGAEKPLEPIPPRPKRSPYGSHDHVSIVLGPGVEV